MSLKCRCMAAANCDELRRAAKVTERRLSKSFQSQLRGDVSVHDADGEDYLSTD